MGFLNKIFPKIDNPIKSYKDFWDWFSKNERTFYSAVQKGNNIERDFFDKLAPKLTELKDGFFYLSGMYNDTTAELVITADGMLSNIVFVEELIEAAPLIDGWKFTALKQAMDVSTIEIKMNNFVFNSENMFFYSTTQNNFPDEININIVHNDFSERYQEAISRGVFIFLDNFLGELNFATSIDDIKVTGKETANTELVPITKLKDYLSWRQKEFIERYEGIRRNTENDNYSMLEAELENGNPLLATINTDLLNWDKKASHPWICILTIKFDGRKHQGMPNREDYQALNQIEEEIMEYLKDEDGYLNVGRQTAEGERDIYFACRDFRLPSKVFFVAKRKHVGKFKMDYDIYKDKYWHTFDQFKNG